MCLTNVNSTTAFLLSIQSVAPTYSYNFLTNTWSKEYQQLSKDYGEFISCVLYVGKNYQRYVLNATWIQWSNLKSVSYRLLGSENHIFLLYFSHIFFSYCREIHALTYDRYYMDQVDGLYVYNVDLDSWKVKTLNECIKGMILFLCHILHL